MSEPAQTIRVATYNIRRGLGRDRRVDFGRIANIILELNADAVALQEFETPAAKTQRGTDLAHRLGQEGYHCIHGPTMHLERGAYGNLFASSLPVTRHFVHDLSQPGREPRSLIEAHLSLAGGANGQDAPIRRQELRCYATHLGLRGWERRRQIERLLDLMNGHRPQGHSRSPLVLLGDFNEWRCHARRLRPIKAGLEAAYLRPTYPSFWPLLPLDRIWFSDALQLRQIDVVTTPDARIASDHLPLRATFALEPAR